MIETLNVQQLLETGAQHHRKGELAQAEKYYRQALAAEPNHPDGLHLLGMLADQCGQHEAAIKMLERAVQLAPNDAAYLNTLGIAQQQAGRVEEANESFRRAVSTNPDFLEPALRLGGLLGQRRKHDEAKAVLTAALDYHPESVDAHFLLAAALEGMGLADEAIDEYRRAILLDPTFAPAHYNLGVALESRGQLEEAAEQYILAHRCESGLAEAANNLGKVRQKQRRLEDAIEAYGRAIESRPAWSIPHENLAGALQSQGRIEEAVAEYRKAVELDPTDPQTHSSLLVALNNLPGADAAMVFGEHTAWAARHASAPAMQAHANSRDPERRLRVGYVGACFCDHPLAAFVEPILTNHDGEQFEVVCYSNSATDDAITRRLRERADLWRDVRPIFDDRAARLIQEDQVDILIDLSGHTPLNRLGIFAHKPAPVQATYLGYPNTTGIGHIDYWLTAATGGSSPAPAPQPRAERKLAAIESAYCFAAPIDAPEVSPLPMLSNGYTTFGCFTILARVNAHLLDLWAAVLAESIGSRLVLRAPGLADEGTRQRLIEQFAARYVTEDRIDLLPLPTSERETLEAYAQIDLALDTLPHNGLLATCQAMWMGVPVLTLAGDRVASRIGSNLLRAAALDEFIVGQTDDYILEAALAGAEPERIRDIRSSLRERMRASRLMDGKQYVRNLEQTYRGWWRDYCAGAADGGTAGASA